MILNPPLLSLPSLWDSSQDCGPKSPSGRFSILAQVVRSLLTQLTRLSPPHKDLEQYAASYSGLMRIERLQFIADRCPPLRVEALKMALSFVQRTFNVDMYEEIHRKLSEATRELQNAPDAIPESGVEPPPLDTAWVEATRKKALLKLEKLDTDLKNYKGNSIKESIRCWASLGRGGGQPGPNGPSTSIHSLPGLQARPR